jgi:hypothetical protein
MSPETLAIQSDFICSTFFRFELNQLRYSSSQEPVNGYNLLLPLHCLQPEDEGFISDGANDPPPSGRSVSSTLHDCSRSMLRHLSVSTTTGKALATAMLNSKSRMQRASHSGESIHQPRLPPPGFGRGASDRHQLQVLLVRRF